jgi:uncharacterized membrane protein YheB (UPF0754 family)
MLAVNSVSGAWHVFTDHPVVLLLMPVVGGFIGWITKVLAIWMVFNPIEFKGIGPIGWQGQLPKRAAKFGSHASELILENLIDPRGLVDKLDPQRIAAELDGVMLDVLDDVARDVLGDRWDQLPQAAKAPVIARARSRAPQMVAGLLAQAKDNIDELFDLSYITTSNLIKDKVLLNELVRDTIVPEMTFMKRFGTLFGAGVGAAQIVVFAFTENHLLIPLCGLGVGLVSDWIALQMVFNPREPKRYLGVLEWQGLFFKRREEFAADYARLGAEKVLTPHLILDSLLNGPLADRLFGMVRQEVEEAIDKELSIVEPVVPAAIGSARYTALRTKVVARAHERLPEAAARLEGYTAEAIDIENTARASLAALSDEEYEGMLRPVFKDDEWLVVAVGGGLGFFVGELQVFLLEKLGGL